MIAWLRGIFFCSLDSVAYRPCGTSSLCFLLIWISWISFSGHFVALRFAHLQHAFFFNDVSGSSHGESGALCHIAISDGRKSHLSGFLLDLARLRVLLACLKSYPVFFSLVDLLWARPRPSRIQLCVCTAAGTCSTSRDFSFRRPFGSCSSGFLLLGGGALANFDSLPDLIPSFLFLPGIPLG